MTVKKIFFFFVLTAFSGLRLSAGTADIYYFDHEGTFQFKVSGNIIESEAQISSSSLGRVDTGISYGNGKIYLDSMDSGIEEGDLSSATYYVKISSIAAAIFNSSLVLTVSSSPEAKSFLSDLAEKAGGEIKTVDYVEGETLSGKKFSGALLSWEKPAPCWSRTLKLNSHLFFGKKEVIFSEIIVPSGFQGLNSSILEKAASPSNILIDISFSGKRYYDVIYADYEKWLENLKAVNASIVVLSPEALVAVSRWSERGFSKKDPALPVFLCSNLDVSTGPLNSVVKNYEIRSLGGLNVGFVSFIPPTADIFEDFPDLRRKIQDPEKDNFISKLAEKVKRAGADFVVAIPRFGTDDFNPFIFSAGGVDAVIGPNLLYKAGSKKENVNLSLWKKRGNGLPALVVFRGPGNTGKLSISFSTGQAGVALESVSAEEIAYDPENSVFWKEAAAQKKGVLDMFFAKSDFSILPAMAEVIGDSKNPKNFYDPSDITALAVSVLKKEFNPEVAFLKIKFFQESIPSELPRTAFSALLGYNERFVKAYIKGSLLEKILAKADFGGFKEFRETSYYDRELFSVSGLDKSGLVNGLPLNPNETYTALFPESFLKESEKYQELKFSKIIYFSTGTINDFAADRLAQIKRKSKKKGDNAWPADIREVFTDKNISKYIWRLNLRNFSVQAVNTSVTGMQNFSGASDSRLAVQAHSLLQGSSSLFSEFYWKTFRFDTGLSLDYGQVRIKPYGQPAAKSESADRILLENEAKWKLLKWNFLGGALLGPFVNISYETEFTSNADGSKRKIYMEKAGMKLFEGAAVKDFYTAVYSQQNRTYSSSLTDYGLETGFRVLAPLNSNGMLLSSDASYRRFFPGNHDTVINLKDRLEVNLKISSKIYGEILLSPYFSYFMATSKVRTRTATDFTIGVSLDFSYLFKLKY